jgi:L-aminopeptidase/D-esterase-like protein
MRWLSVFTLILLQILVGPLASANRGSRDSLSCAAAMARLVPQLPTEKVFFDLPGLKVASVEDPTKSTGATLFYFPEGAQATFDARGGSVASVETSLLAPGSYSNRIDGLVFSGGSTMGLAATDGVRRAIFRERAKRAGDFDLIPSVPGAVVYDFCGRICRTNDPLAYPDAELGERLLTNLQDHFLTGRAGAGVTTTASKMKPGIVFGGQGAAAGDAFGYRVFTAVILNPVGDIIKDGKSVGDEIRQGIALNATKDITLGNKPKKNTTLSVVITDAPLYRNQLQRLATTVHTRMAERISPFQMYTDGDIQFAISVGADPETMPVRRVSIAAEEEIAIRAGELMNEAIEKSVRVANRNR